MDERYVVAALLNSREAYDALAGTLKSSEFSEQARLVVDSAAAFYKRDADAAHVDRDVLRSSVVRRFANRKHADAVLAYLDDVFDTSVSTANVAAEYRELRRHNVGLELAARLGAGSADDATDKLLERYRELGAEPDASDEPRPAIADLFATIGREHRIRVVPARLNDELEGGVLRGHHIVILGRPESGKSMFAINMAAGFLRQGLRVLYTGNEEPTSSLVPRFLARMSGIPIREIADKRETAEKAEARALTVGYEGLVIKDLVTARVAEVEALVRKYKPDALVVDQIKNLSFSGGGGNRAQELDDIARAMRRLGKSYNAVAVSVTQAGESAEGKLSLGMGDVDWSNTGIPGAADLIIGIGVNAQYEAANRRVITLCKNKISGRHTSFPLFVEAQYTLYRSKPRRA